MPTSLTGRVSSISQQLRTTKEILRGLALDMSIEGTTPDSTEVDVLEGDAFEVLRLIRSMKNTLAPINQIPPEILTLIPGFWDLRRRDRRIIALTHVCQVWREIFVSCSSLWTYFVRGWGATKTRTYLERSRSSPINLRLSMGDFSPHRDPLFQIISPALGRLKSLSAGVTWDTLQGITACLSRPAPLLERLEIDGCTGCAPARYPELTTVLFGGEFPSLRELRIAFVRTELPWRNMTALTSFTLNHTPPDSISIGQLLDFFESVPRLREIELEGATPTSGAQNGRSVSLMCLRTMDILFGMPSSLLLDHLSIPVGAELKIQVHSFDRIVEGCLPTSLDNPRNLSNVIKINLSVSSSHPQMQLSGPNGIFHVAALHSGGAWSALELLTRLDTSKTEELDIAYSVPLPSNLTHRALLPMGNLRSLTLSDRQTSHTSEHVLNPDKTPSNVVVFPKLEELSFIPNTNMESFNVRPVIEMAAARASRGAKLRTVRIIDRVNKLGWEDALELRKHVLHVEYGSDVISRGRIWR